MRYICFKTIVAKVFDGVLEDAEEIQNILDIIKTKELTCSLRVKNNPVYDSVRILGVTNDEISWRLIKGGSSLKKTSSIEDIVALTTITNEDVLLKLKPKPTRWSTLDVSGI